MNRRLFLTSVLSAAAAPAASRIDVDGMLILDGARTFTLGLYQLPTGPDAWKRAAAAGFHFAHVEPKPEQLDQARAHGMHGWLTTGSLRKPEDDARIRALVEKFRHHPALLFWETEDEPSFVWNKPKEFRIAPEVIRQTYQLLKSLDPARPVYLNHSPTNLAATLARYNPGGDILATDVYPVIPPGIRPQYALWPDGQQGDFLNTSISQIGRYVDKMRQVAGPSRGVWMVLQGFAWERLRDKDPDPKMIRYPTAAETRFMAYQSIVHGATGLVWWGLYRTPPESGVWDGIAATATELKSISSELAAPPMKADLRIEYHDTGHSLDTGLEWIVKPSAKGHVLIAVNADKNPVDATLTLGPWKRREAFEPFGVRTWRIDSRP